MLDAGMRPVVATHGPEVAARLKIMKELIEGHETTLLFTNTRSTSELLTSRFNVWDMDFPLSIHHGSLAKTTRPVLASSVVPRSRLFEQLECLAELY